MSYNFVGMFRRLFNVDGNIVKARAYLSTEGYSELWINGERIGDRILDPANTDYHKRVF